MEKKFNKKKKYGKLKFKGVEVAIFIIATAIVSFAGSMLIIMRFNLAKVSDKTYESSGELKELYEAYQNIVNNYYGEYDKNQLIQDAISGMLESVGDKNTISIDENSSNNFNAYLQGSYEGIGVEIISDTDGNIIAYSVFEDSPASKAGLKIGDYVIKVNGVSVQGKTTTEVVSLIKSGSSSIKIELKRAGESIECQIQRTNIVLNSVTSKILEKNGKNVGYIYISIFANNTYEQFKRELENLESKDISSLIIDVRDNSGGHLTSAAKILSLFLKADKIIYQIEDKNGLEKFYSTGKETKHYPIIILANSQSASASEILASALKEQYGAKLVGEKTYGKGTVQNLITLSNGFQYKITTQHWLTSNGIWINGDGIKPDYEVILNDEYYNFLTDESDNQLQYALSIITES